MKFSGRKGFIKKDFNQDKLKGGEMKKVIILLAVLLIFQSGCMVPQGRYNDVVKKNKDLEQRVSALSGDRENLKKEYAKLLDEKLALKNDYDTAISEKSILKSDYSKLHEEKVALTAKYEKLVTEKNNLEKKVKDLEAKLTPPQP